MVVAQSASAAVRSRLDHPVVDSDGHVREFLPAALPYLREHLSAAAFDGMRRGDTILEEALAPLTAEQRRSARVPQVAWWAQPSRNMRDRATSAIPRLMYERLDEMGLDYAVLYTTNGFGIAGIEDEDLRRGVCRGFNDFFAAVYGPYADRMTVAGVIPMHTPEEALDELDHCARIGLKVVSIPQEVVRPIPQPMADARLPWLWPGQTHYCDTFGLDSPYDYDPVWQRFADLGYAVTSHGALTLSPRVFSSPTNFTYNHQGAFAQMKLNLCKSLYLGGVTRRFPRLPFAFLECGVTWACTLLANIVEIWEKRSLEGLDATDPRHVDLEEFQRYAREWGPDLLAGIDDLDAALRDHFRAGPVPEQKDDYAAMRIESKQDLRDLFVPSFFFGCEGDDRTVAFAFSPANAFGARLQPVLSSDISHWDVRDMSAVLAESHHLVEQGLLSDEDFRDFTFVNPVTLYTRANPSFFDGTALEREARALLAG